MLASLSTLVAARVRGVRRENARGNVWALERARDGPLSMPSSCVLYRSVRVCRSWDTM